MTDTPKNNVAGALLPPPLNMAINGNAVSLADCPPGPFLFAGALGFKTAYGAFSGKDVGDGKVEWSVTSGPDAYCMDSGEFFWGGTTTKDARAELMVHPVELIFAEPSPESTSPKDHLRAQFLPTEDGEFNGNEQPAPDLSALEEIKYLACTAGAPGHMPVPKALARILFLCNRAGVTKKLDELRPLFATTEGQP